MTAFFRVAGTGLLMVGAAIFVFGQGLSGEARLGATISGGVFAMIGLIWWLVGTGVSTYYERVSKRLAADRELFQSGQQAVGVIENVEPTATSINNMPVVYVTVRITPRFGTPFSHTEKIVTPVTAVPVPGHVVNVAFDPSDHSNVALETMPGFNALPGVVLKTRPPDAGTAAQSAPAEIPSQRPAEDASLDRLERLAKLHKAGVLTDAEFAEQKTRLLGESPQSDQAQGGRS